MDQDQPFAFPIFADIADAVLVKRVGDRVDLRDLSIDQDFSGRDLACTDQSLGQFRPSRADKAVEAEDFAFPERKVDVPVTILCGNAPHLERGVPVGVVALLPLGNAFAAADHQLHDILAAQTFQCPAFAGVAPVAQHGDPVADFLHLFQLMADEHQACARVAKPVQDAEKRFRFVLGE